MRRQTELMSTENIDLSVISVFPCVLFIKKALRRRSQVVRQRSAKPLYIGSNPIAASIFWHRGSHVSVRS